MTRRRTCGKRSHPDMETAIAAAIRLSHNNVPLRPYLHDGPNGCGCWHLTKQERRPTALSAPARA